MRTDPYQNKTTEGSVQDLDTLRSKLPGPKDPDLTALLYDLDMYTPISQFFLKITKSLLFIK